MALIDADAYPSEVAGIALIDSSHPGMLDISWPDRRARWLLYAARARARPLGLIRLASDLGLRTRIDDQVKRIYPPDLAGAGRALMLSSARRRAAMSEMFNVPGSCKEAGPRLRHLGTLPLTVITAGEGDLSATSRRAAARIRRWYLAWRVLQEQLARLSGNSTHVIAGQAGHHVHRQDPDLVARVLRDLAQRAGEAGDSDTPGQ